MEKKKTIGIDIDGILAENLEPFLSYIGYYYKQEFDISQITNPSISVSLNLPKKEIISLFREFEEKVCRDLIPISCMIDPEDVNILSRNYTIKIITKRANFAEDYTVDWLANNGINYDALYMLEDLYNGNKSSVECDIYIDDDPRNLYELWIATDNKTICTINNNYNKDFVQNMKNMNAKNFFAFNNFKEFARHYGNI